ncbi:MAG: DUF4124 domain-containing protein [Gallionella sp.]|nr:DUF4124 domain-containing protein [Gallionella sp.]
MKKIMLILLVLTSAGAFAGLSKWVDADGKVHYSDQPPPANVKATILRSTSGTAAPAATGDAAASSAPAAPKTIAEREAELKKAQQAKKEAADRAAQKQAEVEAREANCIAARKNLSMLQEGMRLMEIDDKGERSYLNDEQRQQRIAKAQQDIGTHCK